LTRITTCKMTFWLTTAWFVFEEKIHFRSAGGDWAIAHETGGLRLAGRPH